jgi:hypothetical protein
MIAAAGLKFARLDVHWPLTEKSAGAYEWSYYDRIAAELRARNIRPVFILNNSNALYASAAPPAGAGSPPKLAAPSTSRAVRAFSKWAAAVATHFAPYDPILELWNEPDRGFWPPRSDVHQYIALASSACTAIRASVPQATIIGPAAALAFRNADPHPPFLEAVIASPLIRCLDAISVHYYVGTGELARDWQALRRAVATSAASAGVQRPPTAVCTEAGFSTGGAKSFAHPLPNEDAQAFYLIRATLLNLYSDVPLTILYDWRDDGDDPGNREHRYGLVRRDRSAKPAYRALTTLTRSFSGYRVVCARRNVRGQVTFVLDRRPQTTLVTWNELHPDSLALPPGFRVKQLSDLYGNVLGPAADGSSVPVPMDSAIYVDLGDTADPDALCKELPGRPL